MKLIHCADLHLDSKMTANLTKEQAKERKLEILHTFQRMVNYAKDNEVRVILIAGDLFDTRNVSATARNTVYDAIRMNPDIDFLYLKGNHDNDNFLSKLEEVPANLKMFSDNWISYRYGKIVITGLELSDANQLTAYNSLVLAHDDYNIVTLHGQESVYGIKDQAEVIQLRGLVNKNIDYLALGHIHGYKEDTLDARGVYCYSGCLEGRGFDECGPKGFVLLDIHEDTKTATRTFIPMATRQLYTISVDVTDCNTTAEAAVCMRKALLASDCAKDSLVKFVLEGNVDIESEIQTELLAQEFSDDFYFEKVYDHTTKKVNYNEYEKDESLKGEFIRMVQMSDLEEQQKAEVIRIGIQALSGEEI